MEFLIILLILYHSLEKKNCHDNSQSFTRLERWYGRQVRKEASSPGVIEEGKFLEVPQK